VLCVNGWQSVLFMGRPFNGFYLEICVDIQAMAVAPLGPARPWGLSAAVSARVSDVETGGAELVLKEPTLVGQR
jgi:hypothetical protein